MTSAQADSKKIVLMARTDGLGERLCAMMNAIRFADMLDTQFRFHWTSDIWNPVYHQLDVKQDKAVLGQSIAPQEEIFSPDFIETYALKTYEKALYKAFPGKPLTEAKVQAAAAAGDFLGWMPNQNFMEGECDPRFLTATRLTYRDAFDRIGLHPDIKAAVSSAQGLQVPAFEAIHLRSGDMVFGEVRKWGQWHNKVLIPPVAADLIRQSRDKGRQVILFGQDVDGLRDLAEREGCLYVGDLMPNKDLTTTQRAFFEIALMARATRILAGYSGFSRAACMIGNMKATTPMSLYSKDAYADITLQDLAQNKARYHPMVSAYGYWQVYAMAQAFFNLPDRLAMIAQAQALDPANLLYPVIRCAILYQMGQDQTAEQVIADYALTTGQEIDAARSDIAQQLVFKYYSTDFTHRADFAAFQGAALRPGNTHAAYFSARIKQALA